MITDDQTNFLWLADSLKKSKYSGFLQRFEEVLKTNNIPFDFLPNTKDIWAVDYMPVQLADNRFMQFTYNPSYLSSQKWQKTISDVDAICSAIDLQPEKSSILLDGGNVVRCKDKVILTDRIFSENSGTSERELIDQLTNIFQCKLIFVPADKHDFTGHSDGMIRFIDSNTVVINKYPNDNSQFYRNFRLALHNSGLNYIEIPYMADDNKSKDSAKGIYLNYLQIGETVFIPTFGIDEDSIAVEQFSRLFKNVVPVDSSEIADEGGILNCISWNILTEKNGR